MRKVIFILIIAFLCSGCSKSDTQTNIARDINTLSQSNDKGEVSVQERYEIIRLHPYGKKYCQVFSKEYYENSLKSWKKYFPDYTVETLREMDRKEYDNYLERDIPIGSSRIGGPIVDLPDDIKYPEG